jgi:acetylornithine deacetylase/succinyl-diaminopimelate desuccinylase-like protein
MSQSAASSVAEFISEERCAELLVEFIRLPSVVGEKTTAHLWVTKQLQDLGMSVEHYTVEDLPAPLVLGELAGGDRPGVLFDAHYDTVFAAEQDWSRNPWGGHDERGEIYGRGAVDSKGADVAMLAAVEAIAKSGAEL